MLRALVIGLDFLPHCLVHFMLASFPDPRPAFRYLQYGKAGGVRNLVCGDKIERVVERV